MAEPCAPSPQGSPAPGSRGPPSPAPSWVNDSTQTDDDLGDSPGPKDEGSDSHVFHCRICEQRGGCSCLPSEPPEEYICPICSDLMERPLQCVDGHNLCAACWHYCLTKGIGRGRRVCPIDNHTPMKYRDLVPNRGLWSLIEKYQEAHGIGITAAEKQKPESGGAADAVHLLVDDPVGYGGTNAAAAAAAPLPNRHDGETRATRLFRLCSATDYLVVTCIVVLVELAGVVGMVVLALKGHRRSAGLGVCYFGLIVNGFVGSIVLSHGAPTRSHLGFACCHWLFITVLGVAIFVGNIENG
eukprot:TRINITY_DN2334_c0_g1_i1.p1 TRINITY_DN2334_c0_g1~~TRINITY_DN2334_c0_g1_i1.p1  ORF type:complete len:299 (+),score=84.24 TRINITY_DN2334_c0_g1_i1:78-974(+)